jgi:hypothetical protein
MSLGDMNATASGRSDRAPLERRVISRCANARARGRGEHHRYSLSALVRRDHMRRHDLAAAARGRESGGEDDLAGLV